MACQSLPILRHTNWNPETARQGTEFIEALEDDAEAFPPGNAVEYDNKGWDRLGRHQ